MDAGTYHSILDSSAYMRLAPLILSNLEQLEQSKKLYHLEMKEYCQECMLRKF